MDQISIQHHYRKFYRYVRAMPFTLAVLMSAGCATAMVEQMRQARLESERAQDDYASAEVDAEISQQKADDLRKQNEAMRQKEAQTKARAQAERNAAAAARKRSQRLEIEVAQLKARAKRKMIEQQSADSDIERQELQAELDQLNGRIETLKDRIRRSR